MIYLVGGAPRAGKTILAQQISAQLGIGWISTDLLEDMLRIKNVARTKAEWNAAPEAIPVAAEWFFPCLERFDRFSGRSPGYSFLPEEMRSRFAQDIPLWSQFVRQEAGRSGCPYLDMGDDFQLRLKEAGALLTAGLFTAAG